MILDASIKTIAILNLISYLIFRGWHLTIKFDSWHVKKPKNNNNRQHCQVSMNSLIKHYTLFTECFDIMGRVRTRLYRVLQADGVDLGSMSLSRGIHTPRRVHPQQEPLQWHTMEHPQRIEITRAAFVDMPDVLRPGDDVERQIGRRSWYLWRANCVGVNQGRNFCEFADLYEKLPANVSVCEPNRYSSRFSNWCTRLLAM